MTDVWAAIDRPHGRRLALDLTLVALFGLVALYAAGTTSRWAVLATICLCGALAVRRLWLVAMIALGIVGGLIQLILPNAFAPLADLGYALLFYVLGSHRDQRVRRFGLVAAGIQIVVGGIWAGFTTPGAVPAIHRFEPTALIAFSAIAAVISLGGWVAGYLHYQTQEKVQSSIDAQLDAAERRRLAAAYEQEQERGRIATDMHDIVAHSWAVVAAQADGARYSLRTDPDRAEQALSVIGDTARSAIADLRTLLQQLRFQESSGAAPGFDQQTTLFERMRSSGMQLEVVEEGARSTSPLLALTSYRLLAESLTNALKHGDLARPVHVVQDWRDGYHLLVRNSVGPERSALGTGHGIAGMTERAGLAGGRLTSRQTGTEWLVDAYVPEPQEDAQ